MQQPGKGYQDGLTNSMFLDWLIMFAFVAIVLYCCYKSVYWEWNKLVVREMKKWRRGKLHQEKPAAKLLKH